MVVIGEQSAAEGEKEDAAVHNIPYAGFRLLRVGHGEPVLGMRWQSPRRQLPGGEALQVPSMQGLPGFNAMEGLRSSPRPDRVRM